MGTLIEDAQEMSQWIAKALSASGYQADLSLQSLKEIDRFFDEHSCDGEAVPGGLLSEDFGARMFALASYIGEVLRREYGGQWRADDDDPEGELNIALEFDRGGTVWPVQRVLKRMQNGAEDGIYVYGVLIGKSINESDE